MKYAIFWHSHNKDRPIITTQYLTLQAALADLATFDSGIYISAELKDIFP